jgi:hypothetical protein
MRRIAPSNFACGWYIALQVMVIPLAKWNVPPTSKSAGEKHTLLEVPYRADSTPNPPPWTTINPAA